MFYPTNVYTLYRHYHGSGRFADDIMEMLRLGPFEFKHLFSSNFNGILHIDSSRTHPAGDNVRYAPRMTHWVKRIDYDLKLVMDALSVFPVSGERDVAPW